MCYPVCGMVHIKEPLLLIEKSSPSRHEQTILPQSSISKHILVTNLWEQQCVNTGSTRKYDDGERDDNREDKTHLHDIGSERGRELGYDVTSYLLFVECYVAKKPNLQEDGRKCFY